MIRPAWTTVTSTIIAVVMSCSWSDAQEAVVEVQAAAVEVQDAAVQVQAAVVVEVAADGGEAGDVAVEVVDAVDGEEVQMMLAAATGGSESAEAPRLRASSSSLGATRLRAERPTAEVIRCHQ